MIVVTAATGHLGSLVLEQLLQRVPASSIRAAVRDPAKAAQWAERGVDVVHGDYDDRASLRAAFEGADKLLLISSPAVGQRETHHRNAIEAAQAAGIGLIAYTSLLHADTTHSVLGDEHRPTEQLLRDSGIDWVILRNGWYLENYTEHLAGALQAGAFYGAARDGRVSAASRTDFAAAAVTVLTEDGHTGEVYELGGSGFTLAELAATVSDVVGRPLPYVDLREGAFREALVSAGVPDGMATVLANADTAIALGDLEVRPDPLRRLIGRAPTTLRTAVEQSLATLA